MWLCLSLLQAKSREISECLEKLSYKVCKGSIKARKLLLLFVSFVTLTKYFNLLQSKYQFYSFNVNNSRINTAHCFIRTTMANCIGYIVYFM